MSKRDMVERIKNVGHVQHRTEMYIGVAEITLRTLGKERIRTRRVIEADLLEAKDTTKHPFKRFTSAKRAVKHANSALYQVISSDEAIPLETLNACLIELVVLRRKALTPPK